MDTCPTSDLAAPVRYALTHRPAAGDTVDLVLDLFRGVVQIHTRTIASVEREQAVLVMAKCRRYLQLRGVDAAPGALAAPKTSATKTSATKAPAAKPSLAATAVSGPVVASAAPLVRPAPGSKPKATAPTVAPVKTGVAATARGATSFPAARERSSAARPPARAAAAFDWMFEAV